MKAIWNDEIIAESERTIVIEGNHYFPPESVVTHRLTPSTTTTRCPWKGAAHYYNVVVAGETNPDAAWTYPETKEKAANIRGRIAFWHGVEVHE